MQNWCLLLGSACGYLPPGLQIQGVVALVVMHIIFVLHCCRSVRNRATEELRPSTFRLLVPLRRRLPVASSMHPLGTSVKGPRQVAGGGWVGESWAKGSPAFVGPAPLHLPHWAIAQRLCESRAWLLELTLNTPAPSPTRIFLCSGFSSSVSLPTSSTAPFPVVLPDYHLILSHHHACRRRRHRRTYSISSAAQASLC